MPPWLLAALPWAIVPLVIWWRARPGTSLDAYAGSPPADPQLVSIIVPARDEARNIERCLRSLMATTWPRIEIFVVDDHSTDGTGDIARRVAASDPRVTIMDAPALPDGWFGKQWACHAAMQRSSGSVLLFTDADTAHGPELLARAMRALAERPADLISVMGRQELGTFWERLLMPPVFVVILSRYGGLEQMSRSKDPLEKIANGQFFLVRRAAYDRAGGHEAVRDHVAEDLRIAQEVCRAGGAVHFLDGRGYLATRMYDGLGELIRGWEKNVYAGGRDTIRLGRAGQAVLRALYPTPALWNVVPAALGLAALAGALPATVGWWALSCYAASAVFWVTQYREAEVSPAYALLHPLAGCVMAVLFARAAWRGDRVTWKGRTYRSVSALEKSA
jgi:chlorobactene glucosyltransferase